MPDSLHILALGATGPLGVPFCHDALARGLTLTIYGRNPQKLPASISQHPKPILTAYKFLIPLVLNYQYTRALILCKPAFDTPEDRESPFWDQVRAGIKAHIPLSFQEMKMLGNYVSSIPTDDLKWSMFRVPYLTDDEAKPVNEAWVCDDNRGVSLSRPSLSVWVLDEIEKGAWVGKAPMLSN
ncbi:hypothetical protein BJX62DRAFT_241813 [Aspergillus germanicus]